MFNEGGSAYAATDFGIACVVVCVPQARDAFEVSPESTHLPAHFAPEGREGCLSAEKSTKAAVINAAKNANGVARCVVPDKLNFDLISCTKRAANLVSLDALFFHKSLKLRMAASTKASQLLGENLL